jgi:hypothetical protein
MKRLVLALLTVSTVAYAAKWSVLGENDFGTFYVDKATIAPMQGMVQVDTLLNWVEPHSLPGNVDKTYQSEVALAYLDCSKKELAFGSRKLYADSDGMGAVVFNIDLGLTDVRLRGASAGSTGEQLLKSVCPGVKSATKP